MSSTDLSDLVPLADICAVAIAECFRGDGEILANPIGNLPVIGGRLARASFEPDLLMTDGEAGLIANHDARPAPAEQIVESHNPYRRMFDVVWSGRRHVMMGASQLDRHGNQNIAALGEAATPRVQLLGFRGAPGNTISHATSYWVPAHSRKVFVPAVDVVTGIGYDRARRLGSVARFHEIRRVVTNLGVFDFDTPDRTMRVRSLHPGVTIDEVRDATGFDLVVPDELAVTRLPTPEEIRLLDDVVDADGVRHGEIRS